MHFSLFSNLFFCQIVCDVVMTRQRRRGGKADGGVGKEVDLKPLDNQDILWTVLNGLPLNISKPSMMSANSLHVKLNANSPF